MDSPEALLKDGHAAAVEAEAGIQKCHETGARLGETSEKMRAEYDRQIVQVHKQLLAEGIGTNPDLEERLRRLLLSRNACAQVSARRPA